MESKKRQLIQTVERLFPGAGSGVKEMERWWLKITNFQL